MSAQPLSRADQAEQADLGAPACLSIGPAREPLAAGVLDAVEAWRVRLADAGIACRAVALYGQDAQYQLDFPADLGELGARWQAIRGQIAVGQAMAKNPLPIVVPCHRVLGRDGSLTGYAGGLQRKSALLELERAT